MKYLDILVSKFSDKVVFGLHPETSELLDQQFPEKKRIRRVVLGHEVLHDFSEHFPESVEKHIAFLLLGLNEQDLNNLKSYKIRFLDSVSKKTVFDSISPNKIAS